MQRHAPGLPTDAVCTHLSDIPDAGPLPPFSELCADAITAINKCLQSKNPLRDCQDLPDIILEKLICPNLPIPGLCPGAGAGNTGGALPSVPVPVTVLLVGVWVWVVTGALLRRRC